MVVCENLLLAKIHNKQSYHQKVFNRSVVRVLIGQILVKIEVILFVNGSLHLHKSRYKNNQNYQRIFRVQDQVVNTVLNQNAQCVDRFKILET